jgi:hypothetical protein
VLVCWGLLGWGEGRGEGGLPVDAVEVDTSVGARGRLDRARLMGLPDGVASDSVGEAVSDFRFFFRDGGVDDPAAIA